MGNRAGKRVLTQEKMPSNASFAVVAGAKPLTEMCGNK
jgi:hypothetical protein